jgi:cytoskeletal protein RodZ
MSEQAAVDLQNWEARHHNPQIQSILEEMKNCPNEGPGRFLTAMREALGLSVVEVASRLSIGVQQLTALEQDDFDNLPAPIFVRNFFRRYSDFLEIPLEAILSAYELRVIDSEPELARVSLRERLNSRSLSMRWATWTAVGLFVVVMLVWWQGREPQTVDTGVEAPVSAGESITVPIVIDPPASSSPSIDETQ